MRNFIQHYCLINFRVSSRWGVEGVKVMHRMEAGQVIYYFSSKPFVVISSPPWFLLETDMNRFTGPFLQISLSTPIPHSTLYMQQLESLSYCEKWLWSYCVVSWLVLSLIWFTSASKLLKNILNTWNLMWSSYIFHKLAKKFICCSLPDSSA